MSIKQKVRLEKPKVEIRPKVRMHFNSIFSDTLHASLSRIPAARFAPLNT